MGGDIFFSSGEGFFLEWVCPRGFPPREVMSISHTYPPC